VAGGRKAIVGSAFPRPNPNSLRLQRYLAQCGVASRRAAEQLIREGRVAVDGRIVSELGVRVDPTVQKVAVDGQPVVPEPPVVLLYHKPRGLLCTNRDPFGRVTYRDRLPESLSQHLFYCGRLDRDSEGLMLLTNDGALAQRVTHPRHHVLRIYQVWTQAPIPGEALGRMTNPGIWSEGECLRTIRVLPEGRDRLGWRYRFELGQGRKRQIRRMAQAVGAEVIRLVRVAIGPLRLDGLKPGEWRPLSPRERNALEALVSDHVGGT